MALDESGTDTVLGTLAFVAVDDVLIICHSKANPSNTDWDAWMERARRPGHRAILVSTEGGAPNAGQRASVAEATRSSSGRVPRVALLTDSTPVRYVVTAIGWMLGDKQPTKVFPRAGIAEAVSWLGASGALERVRAAVDRLHSALARAPNKSSG